MTWQLLAGIALMIFVTVSFLGAMILLRNGGLVLPPSVTGEAMEAQRQAAQAQADWARSQLTDQDRAYMQYMVHAAKNSRINQWDSLSQANAWRPDDKPDTERP